MAFKVMMKGMSAWTEIQAASYEQDGSGTRFFDADGKICASFGDGQLVAVLPDSVETPVAATSAEEGMA